MKAIIVTGTPATGKTTLARTIATRLGLVYIDVNDVIIEHSLCDAFDKERDCKVIDEDRLSDVLAGLIDSSKTMPVIDSHMSHFIPKDRVEVCIVTKCDLKELKKRLEARGYGPSKVKENMDAEIFDICRTEALEEGHDVIIVDTSKEKDTDDIIERVRARIKTGRTA